MATPDPTQLAAFLGAERAQESGGNYQANNPGGASGAYQFEQGTWDTWVAKAGFPQYVGQRPSSAPPAVQDAAAKAMATSYYSGTGSWLTTAEDWYYPAVAGTSAADSTVPPGNTLTVGQYGQDVLAKMASILGGNTATLTGGTYGGVHIPGYNLAPAVENDLAAPVIDWIDNWAMRAALFTIGAIAILVGLLHLTTTHTSPSSSAPKAPQKAATPPTSRPQGAKPRQSPTSRSKGSQRRTVPSQNTGAASDITTTLETAAEDA